MTMADGRDLKPWLDMYPDGVPEFAPEPPFKTLADLVRQAAATYGKRPAYTIVMPNGMFGNLSFAQVDEMSDEFAVYLREDLGLNEGDRVALQAPNSLPIPVVAFGVFKAGCVLVNINPLYTGEEMGKQFKDAEPQALIIVDMFTDKLAEALKSYAIPNIIVTRVPEFMPRAVRGTISAIQKYWDQTIKPISQPHVRLPDALKAARKRIKAEGIDPTVYAEHLDRSAVACLQYTGGTTGVSKGAILTQGNLVMNMSQTMTWMDSHVKKGEEVVLTAIPTYHILAFTLNLLGFFWLGNRNLLIPNPRPLSSLKRAFENYQVTWIVGVNTLFNGLMNEFWFSERPPKHLKASFAGGMALHGPVADRWREMTGTDIIEGYGLTETSPVLTGNPIGGAKIGTIGLPMPSTEIKLLDDEGNEVAPGEAGELSARGPQVMTGYWQNEVETAKVMTADGFFRTGDIAVMEPNGFFRIVDRKKDMIIVSGFNVYPNEIEDCLAGMPGVVESAVIGVSDGEAGEAVKAFIVTDGTDITLEAVRAYCREHLTGYKVPKQLELRGDLPKSNVGKILRKDLRVADIAAHPAKTEA
jgi:long-chain acyl-CoA synthetase